MCGVVGRFNRNGAPVDPRDIARMCGVIVHRGPDDSGQHVSGAIGLGLRRLSIIDPAGGHQPMSTDDAALTVVFNGEIYNYRELRRELQSHGHRFRTASDTECILHAHRQWGDGFLERLNGMFAIALWDERRQRLLLARDRLGVKPLYVYYGPGEVRFASEIKALLVDPSLPRTLDRQALVYFLRYGYVAAPATLFRHVRKLPPAHYVVADAGGVLTRRYWRLDYSEHPATEAEHGERVRDVLEKAVARQLTSDVPVGAFLSGGLDSSSIVALMSAGAGQPVRTFSIGFGSADSFHDELRDAGAVASHYGTLHQETVARQDSACAIETLVRHLDEPLADSSFVVTHLASKLAAQSVKVVLSGVGGDEIFGGYRRYLGPALAPWFGALPRPLRAGVKALADRLPVDRGSALSNYARLGRNFVRSHDLVPFERYDQSVRILDDETIGRLVSAPPEPSDLDCARQDNWHRPGVCGSLHRMMRLDLETSLPDCLLLLTDKMTMAASLEGRVPFLDHDVVEAVAQIPASLKIKRARLRHIQKVAMRGRVPDRVLKKRKRGFGFPLGSWLGRDLRELAHDVFSPAHLTRQGLVDPDVVEELLALHRSKQQDYCEALLGVLTLSLWFDQARVTL